MEKEKNPVGETGKKIAELIVKEKLTYSEAEMALMYASAFLKERVIT